MTVTISTTPAYPAAAPRGSCSVLFAHTQTSATRIVIRPVAAPPESSYGKELAKRERLPGVELPILNGEIGTWSVEVDYPGVYTFEVDEVGVSTVAPRFEDDSVGKAEPTILETSTVRIYFGERVNVPLQAGNDSAQLVLYVWDDTIRETTFAQHGIDSPAIENPRRSKIVDIAMQDESLKEKVSALVGVTVTSLLSGVSSLFNEVRAMYASHAGSSTYHASADTDNAVPSTWSAGDSKSAEASIAKLYQALEAHTKKLRLLEPASVIDGDVTWAVVHYLQEGTSSCLTSGYASGTVSQISAIVDIYYRIKTHASVSAAHKAAQSIGPLSSHPLADLFLAWFSAIRSVSVGSPPDYRNQGAARLEAAI